MHGGRILDGVILFSDKKTQQSEQSLGFRDLRSGFYFYHLLLLSLGFLLL